MNKKAIIYIELFENKVLNVSKEIISKARKAFLDTEINGVVILDDNTFEQSKNELLALNLDKIYVLKDDIFDNFSPCLFSKVLSEFLMQNMPDIFLMGATPNGRDLAPRTASRLNIGLTADCTDLELDDNCNLLATRPTYGGKLMATIFSKTKPNFATIRPGAFKNEACEHTYEPEIVMVENNLSGLNCLLEVLNCKNKSISDDWTCSEVIIAGGFGLKSKENFELVYKLANLLNAKPAASRVAVEQGWASSDIQVGQTGFSVSPKLYIAFGISGAMQHMSGITNADKIIAINTDINAPIMKLADYAINADATDVLRQLILEAGQ